MLLPAVLGGIAGAILTTFLPAARQWLPRWFGFLKFAHVRSAAGVVFGIAIATAINLSTSDHSHEEATYIEWYGMAGVAFAIVLVATVVIERRLSDAPPPQTPEPRNVAMNRLLRRLFDEHRGRRSVIEEQSLADALIEAVRVGRRLLAEAGELEPIGNLPHVDDLVRRYNAWEERVSDALAADEDAPAEWRDLWLRNPECQDSQVNPTRYSLDRMAQTIGHRLRVIDQMLRALESQQ